LIQESQSGGVRISAEELDFDDDQIFHYQGIPFTGVAYYEDEPDGGTAESAYVDGLLEGMTRAWYPAGSLKSEEPFYRGVGHGRHRRFREDGSLESEKVYEYGILVEESVFDASGNVLERFELPTNTPDAALLERYRAEFER
jgi:antitoxin component YwqK of YwqJK toxin-antitoxin module